MNLDEYTQHTRTKVLVFGAPKSGKTALVGKLAATHKLHWIDLESGIKTLLNPAMLAPVHRKNINVIAVPDHKFYPVGIDVVREVLRGGPKKICQLHGKLNCPICNKVTDAAWSTVNTTEFGAGDILVIDSLSQLSNSAMNKVVFKEASAPGGEDYKPTFHDYMQQGALLEQVLSYIQASNINVVVISHEIDVEKAETKEKLAPVGGTRNQSRVVAKYFDAVVYTHILNKTHRANLSTSFAPNVVTGSRLAADIDSKQGADLSLLPLFSLT